MRETTSLEIKLKLYHAHGLRPGCQQFMAEAPDSMEEKRDWKEPETFRRLTKLPPAKPSFEDFVLLEQVDHSGLLVTLDPTSDGVPWCTTPIEAESSLGPDSHHPIISLSGIPSAVMVLRILSALKLSGMITKRSTIHLDEFTVLPPSSDGMDSSADIDGIGAVRAVSAARCSPTSAQSAFGAKPAGFPV